MELVGQQRIAAPIDKTWVALNDPGVLKECITGCDTIERVNDNEYLVGISVKIGPVNAKFKGKLLLDNVVPPKSYIINFEGQGGVAGFGKGSADVNLSPDGGGTLLDYTARAQVGGKIAQIGSRLVDSAAKKMADDFFAAFNAKMGAGTVAVSTSSASVVAAPSAQIAAVSWTSEPVAPEAAAATVAAGTGAVRNAGAAVLSGATAARQVLPTASSGAGGTPAWVWLLVAAAVVAAIVIFGAR